MKFKDEKLFMTYLFNLDSFIFFQEKKSNIPWWKTLPMYNIGIKDKVMFAKNVKVWHMYAGIVNKMIMNKMLVVRILKTLRQDNIPIYHWGSKLIFLGRRLCYKIWYQKMFLKDLRFASEIMNIFLSEEFWVKYWNLSD